VQLLEDDYEIIIAENGAEALQVTEANRPDLILMDLVCR
jgi:CheY-like chemotaxis protein